MGASTHRLEPDVQFALDRLSKLLHFPKNRLINEAVKVYVCQKSRELELKLEANIEQLRALRRRDPGFRESIEAFVEAEARFGGRDPAEGKPVLASEGSARTKIRRILDAA